MSGTDGSVAAAGNPDTAVEVTSSRYVAPNGKPGEAGSNGAADTPAGAQKGAKFMTWSDFQKHLEKVKGAVTTPDPVYKTKSLGFISPDHPVRKLSIKIAHAGW